MKYNNIICYFINLERRKDRLDNILNELDYCKNLFKYEKINAIDANKISLQNFISRNELSKNPRWNRNEPFKRGHLACMISHLNCWKKFLLNDDYDYLLVLEDDIKINKSYFDKIFPKIMKNIDSLKFDWLYLGRQSLGHTGFYSGPIVNEIFYRPRTFGVGNHSYILSRQGARNLVKYLTKTKVIGIASPFQYPSWPLDMMDNHKKFYAKYMQKQLRIFSVIPENFEEKKEISRHQMIQSKSLDFLFYQKNWNDSDTRVL